MNLKIYFVNLGNLEIWTLKTCCIISVLFSTQCNVLHNLSSSVQVIFFFINYALYLNAYHARIQVKTLRVSVVIMSFVGKTVCRRQLTP
jgi:carbon starvation protein CstA